MSSIKNHKMRSQRSYGKTHSIFAEFARREEITELRRGLKNKKEAK